MTQAQAESLIRHYAKVARCHKLPPVLAQIDERYEVLDAPSVDKTMRWLGFCQGYMVACGVYSLHDVKTHSAAAGLCND